MTIKQISYNYRLIGWALAAVSIFVLPGVGQLASLVFISDKEAHFFFFLSVALFLTSKGISFDRTMVYVLLISIFIESFQGMLPSRSFDIQDIFVNIIGAMLGLLFRFGFNQLLISLVLPYKLIIPPSLYTYELISLDTSNRLLFYWYYALYSAEDFYTNYSSKFPQSTITRLYKRFF